MSNNHFPPFITTLLLIGVIAVFYFMFNQHISLEKKLDVYINEKQNLLSHRIPVKKNIQDKKADNGIQDRDLIMKLNEILVPIMMKKNISHAESGNMWENTSYVGNGLIVDEDGYILTNKHVVSNIDSLYTLSFQGETFPVKNIWLVTGVDLAVIKIDQGRKKFPFAKIQSINNMTPLANFIFALAYIDRQSIKLQQGVLNTMQENIGSVDNPKYQRLYQTDIVGKPGESGSIIVNIDGQVVGINTFINKSLDNNLYALPLTREMIENFIMNIKKTQSAVLPYLGVEYTISDQGIYLTNVEESGLLFAHGIRKGDIIFKINDRKPTIQYPLEILLWSKKNGEKVIFHIIRGDKKRDISLLLTGE